MRVLALVQDLMLGSRVEAAAAGANAEYARIGSIDELPGPGEETQVLFVAWDERGPGWAERLSAWIESTPGARLVLFGPHTDVAGHREARAHGIGPVMARSKLVTSLGDLVRP